MMKIEKTPMLKRYIFKFFLRLFVFVFIFIFYLTNKQKMYDYMVQPFWRGISPIHILWLIFMIIMLMHIFPSKRRSMALRKSEKQTYQEKENYSQLELLEFVQNQNLKAWTVMLVWLCFNAIFGLLYLFHVIDNADLLMLTVFYFLCDYICILFYCPFQSGIMKNRCCVNCRIYDWGHFMMFTPMLFIRNFFSWSLFFTSAIVLLKWEITYVKYPQRFWSGSNDILQCNNCKDKTCQLKKCLTSRKRKEQS